MTMMKSDYVFNIISAAFDTDPDMGKSYGCIIVVKITDNCEDIKQWVLDLNKGEVYEGEPKSEADIVLTLSEETVMDLVSHKLTPTMAFMRKKVEINGNKNLLRNVLNHFQNRAKL